MRLKGWGSPNSNKGTYTVVLYIFKYFVVCIFRLCYRIMSCTVVLMFTVPLTVGIVRLCYRTVSCTVMLMFTVPPDSWYIQTLLQNRVMHCHAYVYCHLDSVHHRVGRVLRVSPVIGIGTPPPL